MRIVLKVKWGSINNNIPHNSWSCH